MSNIYIQEPPTHGKVLLTTSVGDIDIELWSKETPKACRNFIQLLMEGYYDGTIFHRVVKEFIAQGGDPTGTGEGGESIYGAPFKDEIHTRLRFVRRGLVAMANAGPNDNGSQFFFTFGASPELNKKHTIFGKVVGNTLFNMLKLQELEIDENDRPLFPPKIIKGEILSNPFDDIVPRVLKKKKSEDDVKKPKSKSKATKNFNLLSFGEEAEEDEEETNKASKVMRGKSKSSHDLIDDPRLSSTPAVESDGKPEDRKRKSGGETEGSDTGSDTKERVMESVRKKLRKEEPERTNKDSEPRHETRQEERKRDDSDREDRKREDRKHEDRDKVERRKDEKKVEDKRKEERRKEEKKGDDREKEERRKDDRKHEKEPDLKRKHEDKDREDRKKDIKKHDEREMEEKKKDDKRKTDKRSEEGEKDEGERDTEKSKSSKSDELRKESRRLQRELAEGKKRKMETKPESKEEEVKEKKELKSERTSQDKKEGELVMAKVDMLEEYKQERQKYKELRQKQGKKGSRREAETLAMLAKFQSKLHSVRKIAGDYEEEEEKTEEKVEEEEEDMGDMSWMSHKLHFEEGNRKVLDANVHDVDRYEIFDPRNPLTKRRREASKKGSNRERR